jgi:hypothetical protein
LVPDSRTNRHNLFAIRRPQASSVKSPADNHFPGRAGYNIGRPPFSDPIRSPARDGGCGRVVTGFFAYYAVPTNVDALAAFRYHVMMLWMRTLTRRSQKDRVGVKMPPYEILLEGSRLVRVG